MAEICSARNLAIVISLSLAAVFTGCGSGDGSGSGNGGLVNGVNLTTFMEGGDTFAQLTISLNTDGFIIAGVTIPIEDPSNPSILLGSIGIDPDLTSNSELLTIAVNLTVTAGNQNYEGTVLPNGTPLPIAGLTNQPVLGVTVGSSRIYVALTGTVAMIGTALVLPQFNAIGASYPAPVDIFTAVDVDNEVNTVSGLFMGNQPNESGMALFIDLTKVVYPTSTNDIQMTSVVPAADIQQSLFSQLGTLQKQNPNLTLN